MPEYKCKMTIATQIAPIQGPFGVTGSLCDNCDNKECKNPIEKISMSIFGKNKKMYVYNKNDTHYYVTECEGFKERQNANL